jgi:endonuclease YncB( thermonuclease family)
MPQLILAIALLAQVPAQPQAVAVPLAAVRVIDGDTVQADIVCPFGITFRGKVMRAADYDAWESSRARRTVNVTPIEVERGKLAAAALERLSGSLFAQDTGKQDAYGRLLVRLWAKDDRGQWIDVAEFMHREGHTREP